MTQDPDYKAKVDKLLDALESMKSSIYINANGPVEFKRLVDAQTALRPPAPKKEYVLPEEMTGVVHAILNKLALAGGSVFYAYSAIREATASEVQPVKTIPEVTYEDTSKFLMDDQSRNGSSREGTRIALQKFLEAKLT